MDTSSPLKRPTASQNVHFNLQRYKDIVKKSLDVRVLISSWLQTKKVTQPRSRTGEFIVNKINYLEGP